MQRGEQPRSARADDLDGEAELDLGVEAHADLVGADRLDRLVVTSRWRSSSTPAWLWTASTMSAGGDRAEKPALAPGAGRDRESHRDELAGRWSRRLAVACILQVTRAAHRRPPGRRCRRSRRSPGPDGTRIVPGEAVGDVDDVAALADTGDVGAKDDLHGSPASSSRPTGTSSASVVSHRRLGQSPGSSTPPRVRLLARLRPRSATRLAATATAGATAAGTLARRPLGVGQQARARAAS